MPSLLEHAQRIAASALALEPVSFGPWLGSVRSVSADQVGRDYMTAGSNFLWVPRALLGSNAALGYTYGTFRRRGGQAIRFDTLPTPVGLLPALWADVAAPLNAKARWAEEFKSDSLASDGVPTQAWLVTKEAVASGVLDDGRFSQVYVRDQVTGSNYTLGSEYSTTTYPALGTAQTYKVVPLWHESGDGGLTRGTSEFARRFFVPGSRRFLKVGNWTYFPSVLGTPSRWNGERAGGGGAIQANDDVTNPEEWESVNCSEVWEGLLTSDDDTTYASRTDAVGSHNHRMLLNGTINASDTSWTVNYRARRTGAVSVNMAVRFYIVRSDGQQFVSADILPQSAWTTSWADYTATISTIGATGQVANSFVLSDSTGSAQTGNRADITYLTVGSASTSYHNRLIPSGPLPPTHAGSLAKGSVVAGSTAVTIRPDADQSDGAWINELSNNTNLYASIDEATASDSDFITSAANGAECIVRLSDPGFVPASDYTVSVNLRAKCGAPFVATSISFSLRENISITRASSGVALTDSYTNYSFNLTPVQVASITDWTNLYLALYIGGTSVAGLCSHASVSITPTSELSSGWRGNNRFMWGVAYRFEDGSVWMPTTPRFANDLLVNGFNLFTVDAASPDVRYDKVVWSNLPIGPFGTKARILLRTPKIDSTIADNLQISPYDLRVVWEIQDNTTTTYDDYFADDDALSVDVAEAFIRYDHIMPPRSRYIFGGDMRVCHSYGGQNPCAIVIAPVGRTADYDLNLADDNSTAYSSQGSWMQYGLDTSGAGTLTLIQGDGATATNTKTFAFSTYTTLQKLVDGINATSFAVDGQQWRAQLCPGVNPEASSLSLTPHNRAIASCVIDNTVGVKTITKSAGGLSKVAVGQLIGGAAEETGAYVTVITSDTSLTYSGTLTTGTETLYFYNDLGDAQITDPDTSATGFQRVIANSLMGFLYFTESYLDDDPIHKDTVWMTVASPGQVKSAANNFSGRQSNRFAPANASAGMSMGGGAVDQGFVVPFANAIGVIRNTRDTGSGVDEDYRLQMLNESEGCCAWNTVVPGNRFVPYLKPSGLYAADLEREIWLSEAVFKPPSSDAALGTGDFDYEIPLCVAATATDTDAAYASSRIARRTLWLFYRDAGSRPDRALRYDFSGGIEHAGLAALVRDDGRTPWGWSNELALPVTPSVMVAAKRSDGEHFYGWSEANAGSTGDGRIDEFETGDTDNAAAIVGSIEGPVVKGNESRQVSGQEFIAEHAAPTGSTGAFDFTRSALATSGDLYSLTPSTSNSVIMLRDFKMLTMPARVASAACRFGYRQTAGGAREIRKATLFVKWILAHK